MPVDLKHKYLASLKRLILLQTSKNISTFSVVREYRQISDQTLLWNVLNWPNKGAAGFILDEYYWMVPWNGKENVVWKVRV